VAKDHTLHTHPTATESVATGKDRWYQVNADGTMPMGGTTASPLIGNLTTKSPTARTAGTLLACVTCHDPHGVGTAPITQRTFSGANDNGFQMLRYKSGTLKNLCTKCHL
jgi:cytochrome c553